MEVARDLVKLLSSHLLLLYSPMLLNAPMGYAGACVSTNPHRDSYAQSLGQQFVLQNGDERQIAKPLL